MQTIAHSSSSDAPNELRFHDFVSSNILEVLLRPFCKKNFGNFENLKKKFFAPKFLGKNWFSFENWFFFQELYFFILNMNSTCSKLSFEVHNIGFAQNFQIFNFLTYEFSIDDQLHLLASSGKYSTQKGLFLVPMDI